MRTDPDSDHYVEEFLYDLRADPYELANLIEMESHQELAAVMRERLLPQVNLFGYGQVASPYGSGQFIKDLRQAFPEPDNLILSEIEGRDGIMDSIKDFLGKGK